MELAAGLFGSLFGGGGAAAGTAAATTTAAAGTGFSAMSILQGAASIAGVLSTIGAGQAQADSYKTKAFEADMEGLNENAQGIQRQTAMKRELMRVLGENDVNFAAAGIDISQGVAANARSTAEARAASELSIDRATTDARRAMARASAAGYRTLAKRAKSAALLEGLGAGLQTGFDLFARA